MAEVKDGRPDGLTELRLVGFGDDAEAVAVRVNEDDEVVVRAVLAFVAGRTEAEQPLDLPGWSAVPLGRAR